MHVLKKLPVHSHSFLNQAGVNYAVLGKNEQCTGDSARRAGNEYLFNEMAISQCGNAQWRCTQTHCNHLPPLPAYLEK